MTTKFRSLNPLPAVLVSLAFATSSGEAAPVWNVNLGNVTAGTTITTTDNYAGAAPENTVNSTWNSVTSAALATLADSAGSSSAGVTLQITPGAGSSVNFGAQAVSGPGAKLFSTWIKDTTNNNPFTITFGNLPALGVGESYALIIYSDWYWKNGNGNQGITQTAGTGLTGTFILNRYIGGTPAAPAAVPFGTVTALAQDTDPANVNGQTNFARFDGLTPNGSNNLTFTMGNVNGPINGFQLIKISGGPADTTPPAPSPMTWASVPAAVGSSSITMTATTATDTSGVEYFFDETTGNPGGTDSSWQSSPTYTDTGLSPSTSYTYRVTARDKSTAQNATTPSGSASATTGTVSQNTTVWNLTVGSTQIPTTDNFVGAATENTQNSTWNQLTSVPQSNMPLADSTGSTAAGVTLDITGSNVANQPLLSGDKIFNGFIGGAGATANMTFEGLSFTNSYDLVFYSDWWWRNGDAYPVRQTSGTGLTGTVFLNRILSGGNGNVPPLTEDTNAANVTSGAGNTGNWFRIKNLSPTLAGELGFLIGDGANSPFSGFQLVKTGAVPPRADFLSFGLPANPAVIGTTTVTLTMPYGSNVTNLAPTFILYPGATCVPVSGTARNFTTPQTYTVTSSDSLVTKNYIVTAAIAPPLPEFYLSAPASWDGRQTITVQPVVTNLALLQANNGTNFNYQWSVSGLAVTQQITPGVLTLTRSQGSGPLAVSLTMDNGTTGVTGSVTIQVQEPATDPWVERTPAANEKPVNGQFFARNPFTNLGTIFYRGTQSGSPDEVFLKVYKTPDGGVESLDATYRQPLVSGAYSFSAPINAGLITYRAVYGTTTGGLDTNVATVSDLLCGDAYIIEGQSNAQATDNGEPQVDTSYPWIKTYDATLGWKPAYAKPLSPNWGSKIGLWGMDLARSMVTDHQIPVCFINGAVGGTRIDEHQANPAGHTVAGSLYSIYANLLNRVIAARLTHGIRGIFWHQGESDCSNFGPISDYDYTAYQQNFVSMSNAWKDDYPNVQGYVIHQVMPKPCGIGPTGDQLREVQRNIPELYSRMSILNTLGNDGYGGCHFDAAGYTEIADRMAAVVARDFYGVTPPGPVTPPNLIRAYFTSAARTAIALEFDQAISWNNFSLPRWYVDDVGGLVTSGNASGNIVTLQLSGPAAATATLDYLKDSLWSYTESVSTLLYGANAMPALTFANVSVGSLTPYQSWAASKNLIGTDANGNADPDFDGLKNALEIVLGGEPNPSAPGSNSSALLPIPTRNGAGDLVFSFKRETVSLGAVNLSFEWSTDMTFPALNKVPVGAMSSSTDGIGVAVSSHDIDTDMIVITVPAAKAANGKLFGRLHAVAP